MIRISLVFHKLAALCSDSIEPVVEVANMRRQIVVSPTVESVRFAKRHQYPYFFRTVPSMTHVRYVVLVSVTQPSFLYFCSPGQIMSTEI